MSKANGESQTSNQDSHVTRCKILVWLPSPMGDAILCTPALRAIRQYFKSVHICFFGKPDIREVLSPGNLNDTWIEQHVNKALRIAKMLREHKFTHAILFKNSFASALAVFLAKIPSRIGYMRECRGLLLTEKLYPPRLANGKFKPISMIDYYLAIASWLGCDTDDRKLELSVEPKAKENLITKLPEIMDSKGPIIILVPGGAFGPSKCWPSERFAQTADWLINNYNATVVISVSPLAEEQQIAEKIANSSKNKLINLAERDVNLAELKSLFSIADLVITNDTGPRHIAIALQRKVITLFGPNDPIWTDTGYEDEIKLIGDAPCAPCEKPICKETELLCMQAISVDMVCDAAKKLLEKSLRKATEQKFTEISKSFFIDPDYTDAFGKLGLISIDAIFNFTAGKNLAKPNLSSYRSRLQFEIDSPATTFFLKRYEKPPILAQLKNWLWHHKRKSCGLFDLEPAEKLADAGIKTPKIVCYGEQWGFLFEKKSFIVTEKIPSAQSLERKLPEYFNTPVTIEKLKLQRNFINKLAEFVRKFHETKYRHRDLYFSHIFHSDSGEFYLIDLARAFQPGIFAERFRVKDIAQLYYSAPGRYFSKTARLRFYLAYTDHDKLTGKDKAFIRKVKNKAKRMARHDKKHGRKVPYLN